MNFDTERGWQNTLREIRRQLQMRVVRDGEPPLHPVEAAEHDAWQVAHDAVLNRLAEMGDATESEPELDLSVEAIAETWTALNRAFPSADDLPVAEMGDGDGR